MSSRVPKRRVHIDQILKVIRSKGTASFGGGRYRLLFVGDRGWKYVNNLAGIPNDPGWTISEREAKKIVSEHIDDFIGLLFETPVDGSGITIPALERAEQVFFQFHMYEEGPK